MSLEDKNNYQLQYPADLDAHKQLWVTDKDDLFICDQTVYKVLQIVRPKIAGIKPQLVLEEVPDIDLPTQQPSQD